MEFTGNARAFILSSREHPLRLGAFQRDAPALRHQKRGQERRQEDENRQSSRYEEGGKSQISLRHVIPTEMRMNARISIAALNS